MPIFNPEPLEVKQPVPVKQITDTGATAPVYDNVNNQAPPLITDIDGQLWVVDYYKQMLAENDTPRPLDITLDPSLQQYLMINNFHISATDDLTSDTDPVTGTTTITGEGLIYPDTIIPNVGDMFIGRIDARTLSIFVILEAQRESFYKRSVYRVTYRVFSGYDLNLASNLASKVVDKHFFDSRRLKTGIAPIVSYTTINNEKQYLKEIENILDRLYLEFWVNDIESFGWIESSLLTYDPWAINFYNTVIGRSIRGTKDMPRAYAFNGSEDLANKPTLWRVLRKSNSTGLKYLYPRVFDSKNVFHLETTNYYDSIIHTKINRIPMPKRWSRPIIDLSTGTYVLSHAWYEGDLNSMSPIEVMLTSIADNLPIIDSELDVVLDSLNTLQDKELFYNLVLVLFILQVKLKT